MTVRSTLFAFVCLTLVASGTPVGAQKPQNPIVVVQTSMGDITIELFRDKAPKTVENFLAYVRDGFYPGTIFHRVISGFMIQGGGLTADLKQKENRPPIENEAGNGLKNARGTVTMARTSVINSATSQFFINTVDNPALDHKGVAAADFGYAVFGRVTAGMNIVDKIEKVKTAGGDVPTTPITINGVTLKGS